VHLDPKTWWYVSRATGFVGWALLAASVLWGLFITNKTLRRSTAPAWVLDLHRHLGGLAVAFVAVHLAVLPLDTYTSWGWRDLFVPMASSWHPIPIAFGIVAFYALLAVEVSSLLGRRVPRTWWRRIHFLSFPLYIVASVHLFTAGTDGGNVVAQWTVVVVSTVIAALTAVRVRSATRPRDRSNRIPAAVRAAGAEAAGAEAHAARSSAPSVLPPTGDLLPSAARAAAVPLAHRSATATLTLDPPSGGLRPPTVDERAARIRSASRTASARAGHRSS
jgi:DMSO/TMAO reductase YedYZ heme-binding membrane subunit